MYDNKPRRKRKERQPLPWWALGALLLLGAGVLLWATVAHRTSGVSDSNGISDDIYLTATSIIEQATGTAQAAAAQPELSSGATETAQAVWEPLYLTATYMVDQATQMGVMPQSGS